MFMNEQLTASLRATFLEGPILCASIIMDVDSLHCSIHNSLPLNPEAVIGMKLVNNPSSPQWTMQDDNLLCLDGRVYVLDLNNLCFQVLRNHHNHPLAGHFSMNHTLESI